MEIFSNKGRMAEPTDLGLKGTAIYAKQIATKPLTRKNIL